MPDKRKTQIMLYVPPIVLLLFFSFLYPLSVNIPIGGDAPSHISTANSITLLSRSPYPLSSLLFSLTRIIPVSWPMRFEIFMATGYIATGLMLGLLLKKLAGNLSGALSILFWSLCSWDILTFFRDGTMAQLWSLFFVLLFIYLLNKKNLLLSSLTFLAIAFSHPASFAFVASVLLIATPFLVSHFNKVKFFVPLSLLISGILVLLTLLLFAKFFPYSNLNKFHIQTYLLGELAESRIGILLLSVPLGATFFVNDSAGSRRKIILLVFAFASFVATFNHFFGVGAWERRFAPYFIISLLIFGTIGLAKLFTYISKNHFVHLVLLILFAAPLTTNAYFTARNYYRSFNGQRSSMHAAEAEAYGWIKNNLDNNVLIMQTRNRGRGVEWLPALTQRKNFILDDQATKYKLLESCGEILDDLTRVNVTHVFFYTWTERIPDAYLNNPSIFPLLFKNDEVSIYATPEREKTNENKTNCQ